MSGNTARSFCLLFAAAFLIISTECRYFKNVDKRDKTGEYFLQNGARNNFKFQRELTKTDNRKDGSMKGEDENGDVYMKRNFASDIPPWEDLKENFPDQRFETERPRKHREFNWNELKRLENDFLEKTRELEKKNHRPKRYDDEKVLRELEKMDEEKQKREEIDENRSELADDLPTGKQPDVYYPIYPGEIEKEDFEEVTSPIEEPKVDESFIDQPLNSLDESEENHDEEVKHEDEAKNPDVFSLQCEQFIEGVELGEAEKNCCSKQSSCPVISFMGTLGHTCFCDKEFYNCLRQVNSPMALDLGTYYFNERKNKCFTYDEKKACRRESCVTSQIIDVIDSPVF